MNPSLNFKAYNLICITLHPCTISTVVLNSFYDQHDQCYSFAWPIKWLWFLRGPKVEHSQCFFLAQPMLITNMIVLVLSMAHRVTCLALQFRAFFG